MTKWQPPQLSGKVSAEGLKAALPLMCNKCQLLETCDFIDSNGKFLPLLFFTPTFCINV